MRRLTTSTLMVILMIGTSAAQTTEKQARAAALTCRSVQALRTLNAPENGDLIQDKIEECRSRLAELFAGRQYSDAAGRAAAQAIQRCTSLRDEAADECWSALFR